MRIPNKQFWQWCLENEDPEAMAFAERLANLLEPELDKVDLEKGENIRDTLKSTLSDRLRQAGADRLTEAQRQTAFLRLNQCWGTYSGVLTEELERMGLMPSIRS